MNGRRVRGGGIQRENPAMLQQDERMRAMIGVAAELLLGLAEEVQ